MKPPRSTATAEAKLVRMGRALAAGNNEHALRIYRSQRARTGRDRAYTVGAARLFAEAGFADDAVALIREELGASLSATLVGCRVLREAGQHVAFDAFVKSAEREFPYATELTVEHLRSLRARREIEQALGLAERVAAGGARSAALARLAAHLAREDGQARRGLTLLDALDVPCGSDEGVVVERLRLQEAIGDQKDAVAGADQALRRFPKSGRVAVSAARILRDAGRLRQAAEALSAVRADDPAYSTAQVALAFILIDREMGEVALDLADGLEQRAGNDRQILLGVARIRYRAGDPFSALNVLRRLKSEWAHEVETGLLAATVLWRTGRLDEATGLLKRIVANFPNHPEASARLATMLASLGRVAEARRVSDGLTSEGAQARLRRIEAEIAIALEEGDLERACDLRAESIAGAAAPSANHAQLGLLHLLNGRISAAKDSLKAALERNRGRNFAIGRSIKLARSFYGQFHNELAIDPVLSETALALARQPDEGALARLARLASKHPGQLAPGLAVAIALRKLGVVALGKSPACANAGEHSIPNRIVTYWDRDPPVEVLRLRKRLGALNPDSCICHFDDASARAFLSNHGLGTALRAYRLARVPARKADLFRLAYLWVEGGIYMDSDDLCTGSLADLLPTGSRLVVQQEQMLSTIGNNFLAAEACHPTIAWALEAAAEDILTGAQGIWFTTGPGLLTRAFAATALDPETGRPADGHHVLGHSRMLSRIVAHVPLRYKRSGLSWLADEESAADAKPLGA